MPGSPVILTPAIRSRSRGSPSRAVHRKVVHGLVRDVVELGALVPGHPRSPIRGRRVRTSRILPHGRCRPPGDGPSLGVTVPRERRASSRRHAAPTPSPHVSHREGVPAAEGSPRAAGSPDRIPARKPACPRPFPARCPRVRRGDPNKTAFQAPKQASREAALEGSTGGVASRCHRVLDHTAEVLLRLPFQLRQHRASQFQKVTFRPIDRAHLEKAKHIE